MEIDTRVICTTIAMLVLTYFGFEYNSGWAFVGAVLLFLNLG